MKKVAILCLASIVLFACSKDKQTVQVRFVTAGTNVSQFKFTTGAIIADKATPFTGTRDTTVTVEKGTMVKLDSKANSNDLAGLIFVNNIEVASGTDADVDGDGKTNVKLEYSIPK